MPEGARDALAGLSPTDLQTLLLDVAQTRAAAVTPADLLRRWGADRFVRPAGADPRALAEVEARLWELLPAEFDGVELSPVVPLGASSAVGPVSQNRIVTALRSVEVLSDPTNALAIEAAARRRATGEPVHLAASHRVLRAQDFGTGWSSHFRLFALVSSARDTGSGDTEARLLITHLGYWQRVLAALLPPGVTPRLGITLFGRPVVGERVHDTVMPAVPVTEDPGRERGRGYYVDAALRITVPAGDDVLELGDGGFTTWTRQLLSDAKERCLTSCLATERLVQIRDG
jgi:hypothetical protein